MKYSKSQHLEIPRTYPHGSGLSLILCLTHGRSVPRMGNAREQHAYGLLNEKKMLIPYAKQAQNRLTTEPNDASSKLRQALYAENDGR